MTLSDLEWPHSALFGTKRIALEPTASLLLYCTYKPILQSATKCGRGSIVFCNGLWGQRALSLR